MINHSSFELEIKQHPCYFAMVVWLIKFCHGSSNLVDTFNL